MSVDGISLTVAVLRDRQFDVMIIPFTWDHTNLSSLRVGDRVNLECDMIGKYVARVFDLKEVKGQMSRGTFDLASFAPTFAFCPLPFDLRMTDKPAKIRIAKGARKRGPFATIDEASPPSRPGACSSSWTTKIARTKAT